RCWVAAASRQFSSRLAPAGGRGRGRAERGQLDLVGGGPRPREPGRAVGAAEAGQGGRGLLRRPPRQGPRLAGRQPAGPGRRPPGARGRRAARLRPRRPAPRRGPAPAGPGLPSSLLTAPVPPAPQGPVAAAPLLAPGRRPNRPSRPAVLITP